MVLVWHLPSKPVTLTFSSAVSDQIRTIPSNYLDGSFDTAHDYFFLGHFMVANVSTLDYSQHSRFHTCICLFKTISDLTRTLPSLQEKLPFPQTAPQISPSLGSITVISLRFFVGLLVFVFRLLLIFFVLPLQEKLIFSLVHSLIKPCTC